MSGKNNEKLSNKLWSAADQFWENSKMNSINFSLPVLGLIFLNCADPKFPVMDFKKTSKNSR